MSAIGQLIVEFVVEPLLDLAPGAETDLGDAVVCTASGTLSSFALVVLFFLTRNTTQSSMPGWATTAGLFFMLLALAGLLYAVPRIFEWRELRFAFIVAAISNALAISTPFWLPGL
jgi:hypothetical protein